MNLGGVSIPLGTIFKKAILSEQNIEDDTLNYRLLHLQMWLVYWIVHACLNVTENLLLIRYLPLYSIIKLVISLWLVAPIIISETRANSSKVLSFQDLQQEWVSFSNQGCGIIYFAYLKPFFDDHIQVIDNFKLDSILSMVSGGLVIPLTKTFASLVTISGSLNTANTAGNEFSNYGSYFATFFSHQEPRSEASSTPDDLALSEYDVVSENDSDMNEGVKRRHSKIEPRSATEEGSDSTENGPDLLPAAGVKPSWFW